MPRPTIMTDDVIDKLEYAFSLGCSDNEACLHANISPATLYNHQEKNPEFLERKRLLKDSPIFIARQAVIRGMQKNPELALKFLERKNKKEFSLRTEVTGADGTPVIPILGSASIKEIESGNE
jgi:hypothetical protein